MSVDPAYLHALAEECVNLVSRQFGRRLDWSPESLSTLDEVCVDLLADGPLTDERLDLWWQLIGAYTGEVVIRAHGGEWVEHETSPGAPGVSALGVTGFPFGLAARVLDGEPYKSLASFVRALPAIAERTKRD
ncbi:hypothetical protein Q2K19_33235 [Micromonospora soli]|uniref:hypothetical protein n=1 Tax=Micromonospora sp. NBRC 110009 TaxID=3061627 RepID=UPI0026712870|nr:hypothetical protein [Micromonospora sp. NBRC 110009]WKT98937.1 hypothetical protein Q2K19_33235 [Micromonospora sp. NBRC 110009]